MEKLRSIRIQRFKRISDAPLDLENINVLVGGNNFLVFLRGANLVMQPQESVPDLEGEDRLGFPLPSESR